MRTFAILALAALLLPALVPPAAAVHQVPDGVTARIAPAYALGETVMFPDIQGRNVINVEVFRQTGGLWTRVALQNTLRACWFDAATQAETCPLSVPFTSSPLGPVAVTIPANGVPRNTPVDLFVTFSQIGTPQGTPTSHHNVAKNAAIALGNFDLAEQLDYHLPSRVVSL